MGKKELIGKRQRKKILRALPIGEKVTIFHIGLAPDPLFDPLKDGIKIEDTPHFMTIKLVRSGKLVTYPYNQLTCEAIRVIEKLTK